MKFWRSIRTKIISSYLGIFLLVYIIFSCYTYLSFKSYLIHAHEKTLLRRAEQIAKSLIEETPSIGEISIGTEIQARYAPELNERVIRISDRRGNELYASKYAQNLKPFPHEFFDAGLNKNLYFREEQLSNLGLYHVVSLIDTLKSGEKFVIEVGGPETDIENALWGLISTFVLALPVITSIAILAGYFLLERTLHPIDQIVSTAELITIKNLNKTLPVPNSGDEFERMSLSLNRMIERLHEAYLLSTRFTADASHELRTPLTIIRGELEILLKDCSENSEQSERLGSLLEEVERMTRIVEGLLLMSRLEAGEAKMKKEAIDLGEMVNATADQMELMAEDKMIQLHREITPRIIVAVDELRVRQAVVNLLDNAIKYTPQGGHITLRVTMDERNAIVEIKDTGIGILPEALPRVFDRFYRADTVRNNHFRGTGLGLSIVESITQAHGGSVAVKSTEGRGSEFRIVLPLFLGMETVENKEYTL